MDPISIAKDWQGALAGVLVAIVYGFRVWISARKELREDKASDNVGNAYNGVIDMLRAENARLSAANIELHAEIERLNQICIECKQRMSALEKIVEIRKKPR